MKLWDSSGSVADIGFQASPHRSGGSTAMGSSRHRREWWSHPESTAKTHIYRRLLDAAGTERSEVTHGVPPEG